MSIYTCDDCQKTFNRKFNYETHLSRKFKCTKINEITLINNNEVLNTPTNELEEITQTDAKIFKCDNCLDIFTTKFRLKTHIKTNKCKKKFESQTENNNDVLEILIKIQENQKQIEDEHKKEIIELKNTINDLQSKIKTETPTPTQTPITTTNNINSNNTTNNTTNITNNIKIIRFGAENPADKLTAKEVQYIFGCHKNSMLLRSIEVTHFSNKHPEFHNVYIPDKKMQNAIIFNGIKPDLKSVDYVMDELLLNHVNNLDDMKKREDVMITEHKHIEIDDIVDNFRNYRDTGSDKEKRIYKKAEKEIKEMLYNNKDKVIETHKRAKKRKT